MLNLFRLTLQHCTLVLSGVLHRFPSLSLKTQISSSSSSGESTLIKNNRAYLNFLTILLGAVPFFRIYFLNRVRLVRKVPSSKQRKTWACRYLASDLLLCPSLRCTGAKASLTSFLQQHRQLIAGGLLTQRQQGFFNGGLDGALSIAVCGR